MDDPIEHGEPAEKAGTDRAARYDGFISYSHAADGKLAPRLQSSLQRFAKPWWRRRALLIFRDETGLSVNPHLWASISMALDDSRWFILLCSPEAAASSWVNREIDHWKEHHDVARILPVLTDGSWQWDAGSQGFDEGGSSAVPPALYDAFTEEPRHLDLRWARTDEQLNFRSGRFRTAVAELAAPMHGVPREDLESEELRVHRRGIRTAWAAAAVVVVLAVVASIAAVAAVGNARTARENAATALDNERQAESTRLAALAATEAEGGLPDRALLLALSALDEAGSDRAAARNALVTAAGAVTGIERVVTDPGAEPGTSVLGVPIIGLSADGTSVAISSADPPRQGWAHTVAVVDITGSGKRSEMPTRIDTILQLDVISPTRVLVTGTAVVDETVGAPQLDPLRVELLDVTNRTTIFTSPASGPVRIAAKGATLVVPTTVDEIVAVDVATGAERHRWPGRLAGSVARSPDGVAPARSATITPRVVSSDDASVVGYSAKAGGQVRWDLADPSTPTLLFPAAADSPPAMFDPTGARVVGIGAADTLVAVAPDGSTKVEIPLGEMLAPVAVAPGPGGNRVVAVDADGQVRTVDVQAGSSTPSSVTCSFGPCTGPGTWTVELSSDQGRVVVIRTPVTGLPDIDSRQTSFVRLTDGSVMGPATGIPVAFDGTEAGTADGASMSISGLPATVGTFRFETGDEEQLATGAPIMSADGSFVSMPPTKFDQPRRGDEATLQPTAPPAFGSLLRLPYGNNALAFALDREHVIGATIAGQLIVWNRTAVTESTIGQSISGAVSPDGAHYARSASPLTGSGPAVVEVFDLSSGKARTFEAPAASLARLRFDPTSRWLVATPAFTGEAATAAWVLDVGDSAASPRNVSATAATFSANGTSLVTWVAENDAWKATISALSDLSTKGTVTVKTIASVPDQDPPLPVSALDASGSQLAVRTPEGVAVYDSAAGAVSRTLALPVAAAPIDLAFDHDTSAIFGLDDEYSTSVVRAWRADGTLTGVAVLDGQGELSLVEGPDGLLLVTFSGGSGGGGGGDGTAQLLSGPTLALVTTVASTTRAFSHDGSQLISITEPLGEAPQVTTRAIDLETLRRQACAIAGRELTALEWQRFRPRATPAPICAPR